MPGPWNPLRKVKLLNRAAKYSVDGIEAVDAMGNSIDVPPFNAPPNNPFSSGGLASNKSADVHGNLLFIPRMIDADAWYQVALRGKGRECGSSGPFPDTVKGLPLGDGLDLSVADMPADLQFNEGGVGDITEIHIDEGDRKMFDPKAVQVT